MIGRVLLVLACLAGSGCGVTEKVTGYFTGGKDNVEPPSPLVEFPIRLNVIRLWSENTGGPDKQYLKLAPAVAGQRVFITNPQGGLRALDATNGRKLWHAELDEPVTGGPGVGQNSVLLGTGKGEVISVNAETGRVEWRGRVSSEVLSPPLRQDNTVVARTNDGKIYGLDADRGKPLWIYDRTVPPLTLRGTSAPVISAGIVIAGFDGGRLAALDLRTGRLLWETAVAAARGRSELERMVDIDSDPLVFEGVAYVVSFQGQLAAVQVETGRILWSRDMSSYAGFSADERYLYLADDDSHLRAFDRFTGSAVWSNEKLHARAATGPASIGGYVVAGDVEGYLHWLDKETGDFVARQRLCDKRIIVQPLVVGKILYAYCSDGTLAAYTYR